MRCLIEALEARELLSSATPSLTLSTTQMVFSYSQGQTSGVQYLTLTNTGRVAITMGSITLSGGDLHRFTLTTKYVPKTLVPGAAAGVRVYFTPFDLKVAGTTLSVASSASKKPYTVALRGIGTKGFYEPSEPSLQWIFDAYQIPVRTGDLDPTTGTIEPGGTSDEVAMQLLQPAGAGAVRTRLLAVFSYKTSPVVNVGWYEGGNGTLHQQFAVSAGSDQSTAPGYTGSMKFYPTTPFGLYGSFPGQPHGPVDSQDSLNTWDIPEQDADHGHKVRFYPYKDTKGHAIADTYIVAMEESFNDDFQDVVFIVSNVKPATVGAATPFAVAKASPFAVTRKSDAGLFGDGANVLG